MSCKYCDIKMRPLDENTKVLKGENWKDELGYEGGYIGQSYNDKFHMIVYYDAGYACTEVPNVKYCPFCGEGLKLPDEPLIKDEKIRKAVRAWAEACGLRHVAYKQASNEFYDPDTRGAFAIRFTLIPVEVYLEDGEHYTIAELCGEEENETTR